MTAKLRSKVCTCEHRQDEHKLSKNGCRKPWCPCGRFEWSNAWDPDEPAAPVDEPVNLAEVAEQADATVEPDAAEVPAKVVPPVDEIDAPVDPLADDGTGWGHFAELERERDELASIVAQIGDAISPTGERPEEALGTLVADVKELVERIPCGWCDGLGVAPAERFGRDADGAPMVDEDRPCPEGCETPGWLVAERNDAADTERERDEMASTLEKVAAENTRLLKEGDALAATNQVLADEVARLALVEAELHKARDLIKRMVAAAHLQGDDDPVAGIETLHAAWHDAGRRAEDLAKEVEAARENRRRAEAELDAARHFFDETHKLWVQADNRSRELAAELGEARREIETRNAEQIGLEVGALAAPAADALWSYPVWFCQPATGCGARYGEPPTEPHECGPLTAALVTITRQGDTAWSTAGGSRP